MPGLFGAVLTGGSSRRMGRTKALITIDGVPMAARVGAAMREAGCTSVIAYGGDPDELASLRLVVLPDRYPGSGPLGGVLGLLESLAVDHDSGWVIVAACDLPSLSADALAPMVAAARSRRDVHVVVARTSRIEPMCAIWSLSATEQLRSMYERGERALHVAIDRLESVPIDVDGAALANINTPEDLGGYPGRCDITGHLGSGSGNTRSGGPHRRRA